MVLINLDDVLKTIRFKVCQGEGNKEHICQRGSCAYCGISEIMSDICGIPPVMELSDKEEKNEDDN